VFLRGSAAENFRVHASTELLYRLEFINRIWEHLRGFSGCNNFTFSSGLHIPLQFPLAMTVCLLSVCSVGTLSRCLFDVSYCRHVFSLFVCCHCVGMFSHCLFAATVWACFSIFSQLFFGSYFLPRDMAAMEFLAPNTMAKLANRN
jgi:hypothetical protein